MSSLEATLKGENPLAYENDEIANFLSENAGKVQLKGSPKKSKPTRKGVTAKPAKGVDVNKAVIMADLLKGENYNVQGGIGIPTKKGQALDAVIKASAFNDAGSIYGGVETINGNRDKMISKDWLRANYGGNLNLSDDISAFAQGGYTKTPYGNENDVPRVGLTYGKKGDNLTGGISAEARAGNLDNVMANLKYKF